MKRGTAKIDIRPTSSHSNKLLWMAVVLLVIIALIGTGIDITGEAVRKPVREKFMVIDGTTYIPTTMTTKLTTGKFLHAIVLPEEGSTMPSNLPRTIKNSRYYIRYDKEDNFRLVSYKEVVSELSRGKLVSLCAQKFAETPIMTIPATGGNIRYVVELRLSDSSNPQQAITVIAGGKDCPSIWGKENCMSHECSWDDGDEGQCWPLAGCWCRANPEPFDF